MDLRSKFIVKSNETYLRGGIKVKEVTPHLIQEKIISRDDDQRIDKEVTSSDQVGKLLQILEMHPRGYCELIKALRESQTCQYIADRLEKTTVDEQHIQKEKRHLDEVIQDVLIKNFCHEAGNNIPVAVVESEVKKKFIELGEHYDSNKDHLIYLVERMFEGCQTKKNEKVEEQKRMCEESDSEHGEEDLDASEGLTKKTGTKKDLEQLEDTGAQDRNNDSSVNSKSLHFLSPPELSSRISELENEYDLPSEVSKAILSKKIPGKLFCKFKYEYVQKLFPELSEVEVVSLLCLRDDLMNPEEEVLEGAIRSEHKHVGEENRVHGDFKQAEHSSSIRRVQEMFRAFDRETKKSDCYQKHSTLSSFTTRPSNMLDPVHIFVDLGSKTSIEEYISNQIVEFAAACLNERSNGTIHFGVKPHCDDYKMDGEVIGYPFNREQCQTHIHKCIEQRFYKEQIALVYKCIRPPQFLDVIPSSQDNPLSVLEVDVVPTSTLVGNNAFFVQSSDKTGPVLYLFHDNKISPICVSDDKSVEFMSKLRASYTETRRQLENPQGQLQTNNNDLREKILDLLTAGDEEMSGSDYPLLFLSPLSNKDRNEIDFNEFEFLIDLDANAIFDFDHVTNSSKGLFDYFEHTKEQVLKVLTNDDFDPNSEKNRQKKDAHANLLDDIRMSVIKPWIFCNGYEDLDKPQRNILEWKQFYSKGVREALRFYSNEIIPGRARVFFFLFSKDYEIMLEAASDVVVDFKDQWIVFAETEDVATHWRSEKIKRHLVDKKSVEQRLIIGMPWKHVNQTIKQLTGAKKPARCEIPTSTGAFCHLKEKKRNELCDLEILSRSECENQDMTLEEREFLCRTEESNFYRGKKVSWWNFWFPNHVLERNVHERLKTKVTEALEGQKLDDDNKVGLVNIYHQPGAGGSTTARHILWDLRKTYRCCIVRQITEQTVDQITAFRNYEETDDPKPPLVLIENRDDERVAEMVAYLQHKARIVARRNADIRVFCVVLLCTSRTNIPSIDKSSIALKHELAEMELEWFRKKYAELEELYESKKGPDPRFLFSFNILKENFNKNYIKDTASRLVKDVQVENEYELKLLKYLSLMNTFDLEQLPVPVSSFDPIMTNMHSIASSGVRQQRDDNRTKIHLNKPWDKKMSQPLQILLNTNMKGGLGSQLKAFSIINSRLASEIYSCFNEKATTSSMVHEFLESALFKWVNHSRKDLEHIVRNMMKKREDKDERKAKFSPLIMKIIEENHSDFEVATNVLIKGFKLTDDPMICQQIARIYIVCKNWKKAVEYAQTATDMKPHNSYLWDTFGQVYQRQLISKHEEFCQENTLMSLDDTEEVIQITRNGMNMFKKEQQVSERERSTRVNEAGYYGELRMVILLLDTLTFSHLGRDRKDLHSYLINADSKHTNISELKEESVVFLKTLEKRAEETMKLIEDKTTQFKEDKFYSMFGTQDRWRKAVAHIRENLDSYFGEESDIVPEHYAEEDKAHFRRRRVRRLGGRTLYNFLRIENRDKLFVILEFLLENLRSEYWQPFDAVGLMNTVLAMKILNIPQSKVTYIDLVHYSRKCYQKVSAEKSSDLKAYMYFMLLNWPTEARQQQNQPVCSIVELKDATKKWKDAFLAKHPRQKEGGPVRKKETTIFFFRWRE